MNELQQSATAAKEPIISAHHQLGALFASLLFLPTSWLGHLLFGLYIGASITGWGNEVVVMWASVTFCGFYILSAVFGFIAAAPVSGPEFAERIGEKCKRHSDLWGLVSGVAEQQGGRLWRYQFDIIKEEVWRREGASPY